MIQELFAEADRDVQLVWASTSKAHRARPVSYMYRQGRVTHLAKFKELEEEMCMWVPGRGSSSPNRMDALVHAVGALEGLT